MKPKPYRQINARRIESHVRGCRDKGFSDNQFSENHKGARRKAINPMGVDGKVLKCLSCGSYRHLLDACPDSWENMKNLYRTRDHGVESNTQNDREKRQCRNTEQKSFEYGVATKSVSKDERDDRVTELVNEVANLRATISSLREEISEIRTDKVRLVSTETDHFDETQNLMTQLSVGMVKGTKMKLENTKEGLARKDKELKYWLSTQEKEESRKMFEKQCKFEMQKIENLQEICTELVNQITDKDVNKKDTSGKQYECDQVELNRWWTRQIEEESSKFNLNTCSQEIQTFTRADKQKLKTVQELHKKKTLVKQGVGVKATENALKYQVRARDALLINGDKVIRSWGNQLDYHF